ncbi:MAG: AAA family ATPase [Methylophaga sp.]|nr:AAA family ATPase [Methylophaga sp.]
MTNKIEYPEKWHDSYTHRNRQDVLNAIDWMNKHQRSQAKLAKACHVSATTFNNIIKGSYPSQPLHHIRKIMDAIKLSDQRQKEGVHDCPFVETSVYRTVIAACKRAHLYRNFSVVSAFVGTGKTRGLKQYAADNSNVILLEATPDMNAGVLVSELVDKTNAIVHKSNRYAVGTKAEKVVAVVNVLRNTDSLIILDEAETVCTATLEYLRRISDKANIGVVLAGTERLKPLIKDPRGRFGQISSRVGFWPPVIQGITEDDAAALSAAAFGDNEALSDDVLNALWQMCDGSARVLVSALIPGVKDYGLKKGSELSPELIIEVGQKVLGFTPRPVRKDF